MLAVLGFSRICFADTGRVRMYLKFSKLLGTGLNYCRFNVFEIQFHFRTDPSHLSQYAVVSPSGNLYYETDPRRSETFEAKFNNVDSFFLLGIITNHPSLSAPQISSSPQRLTYSIRVLSRDR